jgi:methyl-accepting chemotaxis protein
LSQFIEEADGKQDNLRKTLEQAEKTTLAVGNALEKLDKAAGSLGNVAKDVTETTQAWESAAKATGDVVQEFNKKKEPSGKTPPFNINEYQSAAEQTSQAANDIEGLLASIDSFLESRDYSRVINAVTLRAIGFVVLIFVLAVTYRIISARMMKTQGLNAAIKPVSRGGHKR